MMKAIRLDIAKQVFQVLRTDKAGCTIVRRMLRGSEVARFSSGLPCLVWIGTRDSAHNWTRLLGGFGHTVRIRLSYEQRTLFLRRV